MSEWERDGRKGKRGLSVVSRNAPFSCSQVAAAARQERRCGSHLGSRARRSYARLGETSDYRLDEKTELRALSDYALHVNVVSGVAPLIVSGARPRFSSRQNSRQMVLRPPPNESRLPRLFETDMTATRRAPSRPPLKKKKWTSGKKRLSADQIREAALIWSSAALRCCRVAPLVSVHTQTGRSQCNTVCKKEKEKYICLFLNCLVFLCLEIHSKISE